MIAYAQANNNTQAAKYFHVDRKRVIEWRKTEQELKGIKKKSRKRLSGAGRKAFYPDIECQIFRWLERRREMGVRVTGKALKKEALRLHRSQDHGDHQFKASCGWLRRFMKRQNLSFRRATHVAQKNNGILDDRNQNFLRFVTRIRRIRDYALGRIGNMDETPIWVDMPGDYTIEQIGKKTISMKSTGNEKSRITVMLCAMADGSKVPPMVLFKGVRPPTEKPPGVIVKMTPQAWANEEVCLEWLRLAWRVRAGEPRRLLIWDSFSGHKTAAVKQAVREQYNSDMAIIPGGMFNNS